jgi:hypothetical protein
MDSMIFAWISKNLEGCDNPKLLGKGRVQDKKAIGDIGFGIIDYHLTFLIID